MRLVNFPVQTMRSPSAKGSSVPACPTFIFLSCRAERSVLRIFFTTSKEVHRNGLLISKVCHSM